MKILKKLEHWSISTSKNLSITLLAKTWNQQLSITVSLDTAACWRIRYTSGGRSAKIRWYVANIIRKGTLWYVFAARTQKCRKSRYTIKSVNKACSWAYQILVHLVPWVLVVTPFVYSYVLLRSYTTRDPESGENQIQRYENKQGSWLLLFTWISCVEGGTSSVFISTIYYLFIYL